MRLCQRSIMWKLGLGDVYFKTKMKLSIDNVTTEIDENLVEDVVEESNNDTVQCNMEIEYGEL
jgi:hypothetical protein